MTENLVNENEANYLSKLATNEKKVNVNLPVDKILSDENPIPVS